MRTDLSRETISSSADATCCQGNLNEIQTEDRPEDTFFKEQPSPGKKSFACSHCSKKFTLRNNLTRHVKMKHLPPGQRLLICHRCKFKTFDLEALKAHNEWHAKEVVSGCSTPGKPYQCYHCGSRFVSLYSVRKHIISSHPIDKIFKCEFCPYYNGLKYRFLAHLAIHRDPKYGGLVATCDVCGASTTKSYLAKHMLVCHSGLPAPHACTQCNFKTWFSGDFISHSYIHTGERPFGCYHCGHTAKRKTHIRLHVESCFKRKWFFCPYCSFKSKYQTQGRKHVAQYHQEPSRPNLQVTVKKEQTGLNEGQNHRIGRELAEVKEESIECKMEPIDWEY